MADKKQLEILKSGVENWNKFRIDNLGISKEFFSDEVTVADLIGADLVGADLIGANLVGADLVGANLIGANLTSADLTGAKLISAHLGSANLSDAMLAGVDFSGSVLSEAIFVNSIFVMTTFSKVDLSKTIGLETCMFYGESIIDYHTLKISKNLPYNFLRGCGLTDKDIEKIPLFFDQAIQFYSCFISYANKDEKFAKKLYSDLQNSGIRCWFAPKNIKSGRKLHEQIELAIDKHDKFLIILSESSLKSNWVKTEIAKAREREEKEGVQILFPISITDFANIDNWKCFDADRGIDSAKEIREYFIPDFTNWENDQDKYKDSFERLVRDLKQDHPIKSKKNTSK